MGTRNFTLTAGDKPTGLKGALLSILLLLLLLSAALITALLCISDVTMVHEANACRLSCTINLANFKANVANAF